jgi:hypothetical protein
MIDENAPLRPTMRLPLNDKAAKRPDTKLENRPLKPVASFRFNSEGVVKGAREKVHGVMERLVDTPEGREAYPDLFRPDGVLPAEEWSARGARYSEYYDELYAAEDAKLAKVDKNYKRDRNQGVFLVSVVTPAHVPSSQLDVPKAFDHLTLAQWLTKGSLIAGGRNQTATAWNQPNTRVTRATRSGPGGSCVDQSLTAATQVARAVASHRGSGRREAADDTVTGAQLLAQALDPSSPDLNITVYKVEDVFSFGKWKEITRSESHAFGEP